MTRLRILFVIHDFPPSEIAGTELLALGVGRHLVKNGNEVSVFCAAQSHEQEGESIVEGIRVHRVFVDLRQEKTSFSGTYLDERIDRECLNFVSDFDPNIALVWHTIHLSTGILEILSGMHVPYVLFLPDFYYLCHQTYLLTAPPDMQPCDGPGDGTKCKDCIRATTPQGLLEREGGDPAQLGRARVLRMKRLVNNATAIIAPSEFVAEKYVEFGADPDTIKIIRPGVDVESIRAQYKREESHRFRFGYLGGDFEHKGISVLFDAFRAIQDDNVELVVAGPRSEYLDRAPSMPSNVHTLGKFLPQDLGKVLSQIDVLVVPSRCRESYCLVIREAFAARIPVIVSDLRAQSDAVSAGVNGLLFEAGDASDLASKMLLLKGNSTLVEELRHGVPVVPNIESQAAEMSKLLADLVERQEHFRKTETGLLGPQAQIDRLRKMLAHSKSRSTLLESELAITENRLAIFQSETARLKSELQTETAKLKSELFESDARIAGLQNESARLQLELSSVKMSLGYKMMRFYAARIDRLFPAGTSRGQFRRVVVRSLEVITNEGPRSFLQQALMKTKKKEFRIVETPQAIFGLSSDILYSNEVLYGAWIVTNVPDVGRLRETIETFRYRPKISIVMPVFNTDEKYLTDAIESVKSQLYEVWELCICDDGSTQPGVKKILEEAAQADRRIKVTSFLANKGISAASNAALAIATGEFVGFLDHDDLLYPEALVEVVRLLNEDQELDFIYSDEDKIDQFKNRTEPFFKPDWSPDLLLSVNYVTHFSVYRASLLRTVGGLRAGFEGSQDYDLVLRVTEKTRKIGHVRRPLYGWRKSSSSTAASETAKPIALVSAVKALEDAMSRRGMEAQAMMLPTHRYRVRYAIKGRPLISIIIPTGTSKYVSSCVKSILKKSKYDNYEIIVVDNGTGVDLSKSLPISKKVKVLVDSSKYNFSRINNEAAKAARGEYLVFLNDDTEVISGEWLSAMLEHAQREEVGAVGAKLLYRDGKVQHAGIIVGIDGYGTNYGGMPSSDRGYFLLADMVRNCSAVTGACMMVRKDCFFALGGFDEALGHSWNDVDFGVRILQSGRLVVFTPFALLYHYEGGTRGRYDRSTQEWEAKEYFRNKHLDFIKRGDPYYNPNLSLAVPYHIHVDLKYFSDPNLVLTLLYASRPDLRRTYPEVATGDFSGLMAWASKVTSNNDSAAPLLLKHKTYYAAKAAGISGLPNQTDPEEGV